MRPTLALLHTSPTLAPLFGGLAAEHLPEAQVFHMCDESLIKNTIRSGRLETVTVRRLIGMIGSAFEAGADAVLVTCSSIGPGVDAAKSLYDRPVLRVDEAMAEAVVAQGRRIGVAATLRTTLEPTIDLVRRKAAEAGRPIDIVEKLCEGAFEAVMAGDGATHDQIVGEGLTRDLADVDAIVLAQASMARVLGGLEPGAVKPPVFTSPELGVRSVRKVLLGQAA